MGRTSPAPDALEVTLKDSRREPARPPSDRRPGRTEQGLVGPFPVVHRRARRPALRDRRGDHRRRLPYLESTAIHKWNLSAQQISFVVAAVLLGSVLSSLFAGMLSDLFGAGRSCSLSGLLFVASIPMIALAGGYGPLMLGRLLQGVSGGLIGVAVPLYLAECLPRRQPREGHGHLPVALDLGVGRRRADRPLSTRGPWRRPRPPPWRRGRRGAACWPPRTIAWRNIFWMSITPGIIFTVGTLLIAESLALAVPPRQEGCRAGRAVADPLGRRRPTWSLREMEADGLRRRQKAHAGRGRGGDSLLQPQVRPALRDRLHHPCLQPGHGRQFHPPLHRQHPQPGRPARRDANQGDVSSRLSTAW